MAFGVTWGSLTLSRFITLSFYRPKRLRVACRMWVYLTVHSILDGAGPADPSRSSGGSTRLFRGVSLVHACSPGESASSHPNILQESGAEAKPQGTADH